MTRPEATTIDDLLLAGVRQFEISQQTGVPIGYIQHRAKLLRAAEGSDFSGDTSCPRFAEHDAFCQAVKRAAPGGMPVLVLDGPSRGSLVTADHRPWSAYRNNGEWRGLRFAGRGL